MSSCVERLVPSSVALEVIENKELKKIENKGAFCKIPTGMPQRSSEREVSCLS